MQKKGKEEKTCNYPMLFGKTCDRPRYDHEHCIFHSEDIEGKKREFYAEFRDEFDRQKKEEEIYDFSGFVFPAIVFDKKDFKRDFDKNAYFSEAKFKKHAFFRETNFLKGAYFSNARFSDWVNFDRATFSGDAYFKDTKFFGMTQFTRTTFSGETEFQEAKFWQETNFNEAKFSGSVNFESVKCKDISKVEMVNTYFYDVTGLLEILEENKKSRNISKYRTEFLSEKVKIILGEKSTAEYPLTSRQIQDDRYILEHRKKHPIWFFIWWLFADCGRKFWKWSVWCLGIAFVFSWIFYCYYSHSPSSFQAVYVNEWCPWFSFFYYSVVTFTTLGFGDIVPKCGWLQFFVMLEVILGYVMLGGLISILANKLARRS